MIQLLAGDAVTQLRCMPDCCVNICVTSPPYYGLRDYGIGEQLGFEDSPEAYIYNLVSIFREVRRVLRDDGTLWVVIGDSYAADGHGNTPITKDGRSAKQATNAGTLWQVGANRRWNHPDIKKKDLIGIPWMLAFALRADGWYLRQDIIWYKHNCMPESVRDRCTKSHEYIFMLSKSQRYYFDVDILREPCSEENTVQDFKRRKTMNNKGNGKGTYEEARPDLCRDRSEYIAEDFKRRKRDVWQVNTKPYKGAHFATFPPDLIRPCVLAGCPKGGVILDPFVGSGTTAVVAVQERFNCIGIDINAEYIRLAQERVNEELKKWELS